MIFYFSGTGNSRHVARVIAEAQQEPLLYIPEELEKREGVLEYRLKENELVGFVYPVYAWGPPQLVLDFIGRMDLQGERPYLFSLCTCGDEEGRTTARLEKHLKKKGMTLSSAFSMVMPNNYIIGFDVDSAEQEKAKLNQAEKTLAEINGVLANRKPGVFQLIPGSAPGLKSALIFPLFNRYKGDTKRFYATDECTRCGICEEVCPVHIIKVAEKPVWEKGCTQCLACVHRCPTRAIQYGKGTLRKGRYLHPDLR